MNKSYRRVGVITGCIHLMAVLIFYGLLLGFAGEPSQSAFYWMIWFPVDFPVSLLVASETVIKFLNSVVKIPCPDKVYLLLHGIVGSIWWGILACGIYFLYCRIQNKTR